MNMIEVATKLNFTLRGRLISCFNKSAHANGDKNPSMYLYENSFQCKACGIKGNKAEFVKENLHIDFQKAMEWLGESKPEYLIAKKKEYSNVTTKVERLNDKVITYLEKRGVPEKWVTKFKLGYLDNSVTFPYFKNGKLVNRKYRGLSKKEWRQEKNAKHCLWLQDEITTDELIICEGEIDAMSLWEYGLPSVSIPSGISNLNWIEEDWDFLQKFKSIYIAMDNDQAGQKGSSEIIKRLGAWRCKNVILPFKDANECLQKKVSVEAINECFANAKSFDMDELKSISDFALAVKDELENPMKLNGIPTSSYELTKILKGWRRAELTVWSGQSGSGKSTFLLQEMLHMVMEHDQKFVLGSFEMRPEDSIKWILRQYYQRNVNSKDVDEALKKLENNIFIIDFVGDIGKELLFEIMSFAYKKYGVDNFIIDSLMKVNLSSDEKKLYGEQKKFTSNLTDFAKKYNAHVHLVAHARKGTNDKSKMDKTDVSGSSDITNLAHNVVVMHRNEGEVGADSSLFVKKNRAVGYLGEVKYKFQDESKSFVVFDKTDEIKQADEAFGL